MDLLAEKHKEIYQILSHFPSGILLCCQKEQAKIKDQTANLLEEKSDFDPLDADS